MEPTPEQVTAALDRFGDRLAGMGVHVQMRHGHGTTVNLMALLGDLAFAESTLDPEKAAAERSFAAMVASTHERFETRRDMLIDAALDARTEGKQG